ncbi:MAG TPA: alpha/beta hydrolase [Lacibacter sp.]|nr:alpha/beta hydrolase [Lacibacter sp.]HMO88817.1 alpha/beta hydrolase [Lacibacter sp.]HMP86878.1 alpha/beta hydrolase [Lacibacter sp.]
MQLKKLFRSRILQLVLAIYGVTGLVLWYLQERLLFHPVPLPASHTFRFKQPHREVQVRLNEKDVLHLVQFYPSDTSRVRGIVLYFHGNRENIGRYAPFAELFTQEGYEVWMPDYPGYGKTTGERTEQRFYSDAALVYRMAAGRLAADSILIYGKSLGTGVACELAGRQPCKKLLLETPYYSIPALAWYHFPLYPASRMSRYRFSNYEHLAHVQAPVVIFQGTHDRIVPYRHAATLRPLLKPGDRFITIKGGGHNNLATFDFYRQQLRAALR